MCKAWKYKQWQWRSRINQKLHWLTWRQTGVFCVEFEIYPLFAFSWIAYSRKSSIHLPAQECSEVVRVTLAHPWKRRQFWKLNHGFGTFSGKRSASSAVSEGTKWKGFCQLAWLLYWSLYSPALLVNTVYERHCVRTSDIVLPATTQYFFVSFVTTGFV